MDNGAAQSAWSASDEAQAIREQHEQHLAGKCDSFCLIGFADFIKKYDLEALVMGHVHHTPDVPTWRWRHNS